jgi:hypothetical protein
MKKSVCGITFLFSFLIVLLVLTGCFKNSGNNGQGKPPQVSAVKSPMDIVKVKIGDKVNLNSPAVFIQVGILYNIELNKWLNELSTQSTNIVEEVYLAKKREAFYKSLGITEEQFAQYNINHYDAINNFLEQNPDYKAAYDESAK